MALVRASRHCDLCEDYQEVEQVRETQIIEFHGVKIVAIFQVWHHKEDGHDHRPMVDGSHGTVVFERVVAVPTT